MPIYTAKMRAPFAVLGIRTGQGAITRIEYLPGSERAQAPTDALAERACRQIERYLADPQFRFSLSLAPAGALFRRRVWDTLSQIRWGIAHVRRARAAVAHRAARGRRRVRRESDRAGDSLPSRRRYARLARRLHGRDRRRSDRDQTLVAGA